MVTWPCLRAQVEKGFGVSVERYRRRPLQPARRAQERLAAETLALERRAKQRGAPTNTLIPNPMECAGAPGGGDAGAGAAGEAARRALQAAGQRRTDGSAGGCACSAGCRAGARGGEGVHVKPWFALGAVRQCSHNSHSRLVPIIYRAVSLC